MKGAVSDADKADFRLLGLEETADRAAIKRAYRRRVKELHPDTAEEGELLRNHFAFVAVCAAYRRLMARSGPEKPAQGGAKSAAGTVGANSGGNKGQSNTAAERRGGGGATGALRVHADPAWAYYRQGSAYYSRIHPSAWNPSGTIAIDAKTPEDPELQKEMVERVRTLVALFPKAYLYFSTVANEYPESPWAADAREKMRLIEERVKRYRNIIESFSEWGAFPERSKEAFEESMADNAKRYAAFPEKERKRWSKT